ncbi:MAG: ABC transporter ATP-binding protein [Pseudomonadota bacterium]
MTYLSLVHVTKSYDDQRVIDDISLDIEEGEFVVLVGKSGCGKSTLLRSIAGLEHIDQGTIYLSDQQIEKRSASERNMAMVFQSYALYPHMTVYENMAFSLELKKMTEIQIETKVIEAAESLKMTEFLQRKPKDLSGGQRQRVAIGRALVRDPDIFLFDEPLSNLDTKLRAHMRSELKMLHKRLGKTMIYVTHDQIEAMTLADKIAVLDEGKIQQFGTPEEIYNHPANKFVASFIGAPTMNFLEADVETYKMTGQGFKHHYEAAFDQSGRKTIGIRPHHFDVTSEGMALHVTLAEFLGNETVLTGYIADTEQKISVNIPGNHSAKLNDVIYVKPKQEYLHFFETSC